jgi:hypothetical protein
MTGPHDNSDTRPISVAELLARNGSIGSPPVGGRRRRRRGNTDAVTVAELTGEIPIIREDAPPATEEVVAPTDEAGETVETVESAAEPVVEPEPGIEAEDLVDEPEVADELEHPEAEPAAAEEMLPDSIDIDVDEGTEEQDAAVAVDEDREDLGEVPPSYLNAVREQPLFGGRTGQDLRRDEPADVAGADDITTEVVTRVPDVPPETTTAEDFDESQPPTRLQQIGRGALIVLQSILAVAFGGGLFIAFDQLWKWNNIVALVLSVLVILGLVIAVRIVRKTEDIASTLIAVAVGALVTLGPLALSHG